MLIYSTQTSPRLRYALEVLFKDLLSLEYTLVSDLLLYQNCEGPKIHYGQSRIKGDPVFLKASSFLWEKGIHLFRPEIEKIDGKPALFPMGKESDWPFDLLAMLFYLLSRYEEYLPFSADQYGRFPATESMSFKHDFLHRPILNEWALLFRDFLQQKWPGLILPAPSYSFQLTFDIDMAWAYLYRPWWRLLGGGLAQLLRGNWSALKERLRVSRGRAEDPFYVFPYLKKMEEKYQLDPIYFWLLGDPGRYDPNTSPELPAFQELIRSGSERHRIGIHPSFKSNTAEGQLAKEIKRLETIAQTKVEQSRQHFLMLHFPTTYRRLIALGIKSDYSMGYADQTGFRAGIAHSFPWYDLENEAITSLRINPFVVMDVSLKNYLKFSPQEALEHTIDLIERTRQAGGAFTLLWHNSSFASTMGWKDWTYVFERILANGKAS